MSREYVKEIGVEAIVLPNAPLSNVQLMKAAKKLNISKFRGVLLRDELPDNPRVRECGILNLDDSSGGGTHWVAWWKQGNEKYFFDSYGLPPPIEMVRYLESPVYYNSERIQPDNEVFCGHLCLYVLKKIQEGFSFQEAINSLL
jgi:hypothetical protein